MSTLFYTHPICIEHDAGGGHPESPDRLRAIMTALDGDYFSGLDRREAPKGSKSQIERVHLSEYVDAVLAAIPASGHVSLDPDTGVSPESGEAAFRAVGGVCAAVDAVIGGDADNAFCALRPPGHHAEAGRAMGFCLFNNIAIAAMHGLAKHGLERVAIVDFDVHHGNGSQSACQSDARLFYASSHQSPAYPGSGRESECGEFENVVNVELPPGSGSRLFRNAYTDRILPHLRAFAPQLLLISAGFDAHARDPLAMLELQDDDFAWVTEQLLDVAHECCGGRVVSVLEGGYDLDALASSTASHVRALLAVAPGNASA
jgi:acetoin utilization deacetylase AcuC-like enzyme